MGTLYIVEDEELVRRAVAKLAKTYHLESLCFETAQDCREHILDGNRPDAIISDMRIPRDLEGPENLHNMVKSEHPDIIFYFMTGTISNYDLSVLKRTHAEVVLKEDISGLKRVLTTILTSLGQTRLNRPTSL